MKKVLLLSAALLVLAVPAMAGGFNLAWGPGCWWDNPVNLKTFACDVNTGNAAFTGSFVTGQDFTRFSAMMAIVDLQTDATALPAWWEFFNTGACRQSALSTSGDFTGAAGGCVDPWGGQAQGGIAAYQTSTYPPPLPLNAPAPNRARLKVGYVLLDPVLVTMGIEYYGFRATIQYANTVGTGACAGCEIPMTLVLNSVEPRNDVGLPELITSPIVNACITWQNGASTPCGAVPARNQTWGQVKSLYR